MKDILFLHGWATDAAVWERQLTALTGEYKCRTLTLPGHGDGAPWAEPTLAPAVDSLLCSLKEYARANDTSEEGVVAVGWSLGGQVILQAAHLKPEYFRGVVLVGATPCFVMRDDFAWGQSRGVTRRMAKELGRDLSSTLNGFYALNFTEQELKSEEAADFVSHYSSRSASFHKGSILSALTALINTDIRGEVKKIETPALIIHGDSDAVVPLGAGAFLADVMPNARLEIFNDTGHAPFITQATRFNNVVRSFAEEL
ncbi:MAG: alpha/beta fold hydrolase [Thermodesulfobacteriota bacterium]